MHGLPCQRAQEEEHEEEHEEEQAQVGMAQAVAQELDVVGCHRS